MPPLHSQLGTLAAHRDEVRGHACWSFRACRLGDGLYCQVHKQALQAHQVRHMLQALGIAPGSGFPLVLSESLPLSLGLSLTQGRRSGSAREEVSPRRPCSAHPLYSLSGGSRLGKSLNCFH